MAPTAAAILPAARPFPAKPVKGGGSIKLNAGVDGAERLLIATPRSSVVQNRYGGASRQMKMGDRFAVAL